MFGSFERYHGNRGDDEDAPKHPRELMDGALVPPDEIADERPNPEEALIANEEGKHDEDDPHVVHELPVEAEPSDAEEEYPWERKENIDGAGVALIQPVPEQEPRLPSHSGSVQPTPIPESKWKGMKRHLGRSVGPRGTEPKSKNKRRA